MPIPASLAAFDTLVSSLNEALTTEFELKTPFTPDPLVGERFGVLNVKAVQDATYEQVSFAADIWLVEGFADYESFTSDGLKLALWLRARIDTLREAALKTSGVYGFYLGDYDPNGRGEGFDIPLKGSRRVDKVQQRAEWTLDLIVPCTIVVSSKRCL